MFSRKKEQRYYVTVSGINAEVSRKRIKNLYIKVNRRTGFVRISCPLKVSDAGIEAFLQSKKSWIKKQQAKAEQFPEPKSYTFESGEKHWFKGSSQVLYVQEGSPKSTVEFLDGTIRMAIRGKSSSEKKKKLLESGYRRYLKSRIPVLIKKWELLLRVQVSEFGVKKMKTRWGTCNIQAKRIWLNLELAKKSPGCLESVVVHEMVHLLERRHNARFYGLMDEFYPAWRTFEEELHSPID